MSSSVLEYATQENGGNKSSRCENGDEWLDSLKSGRDPAVSNLSLPVDAFFKAAISIKDQVSTLVHSTWWHFGLIVAIFMIMVSVGMNCWLFSVWFEYYESENGDWVN